MHMLTTNICNPYCANSFNSIPEHPIDNTQNSRNSGSQTGNRVTNNSDLEADRFNTHVTNDANHRPLRPQHNTSINNNNNSTGSSRLGYSGAVVDNYVDVNVGIDCETNGRLQDKAEDEPEKQSRN